MKYMHIEAISFGFLELGRDDRLAERSGTFLSPVSTPGPLEALFEKTWRPGEIELEK
jgi:hypothetical protein